MPSATSFPQMLSSYYKTEQLNDKQTRGLVGGGSQQDDKDVCPAHLHFPHILENYANEVVAVFRHPSSSLAE